MAKKPNSTNSGKIKITQKSTGKFFLKTLDEARLILDHPRFKGIYESETLSADPKELSEDAENVKETKPEAPADKQGDDSTK